MIKTLEEQALMRASGRLLAQVFEALDTLPLEGMSTLQVNDWVERFIVDELHARPASKGQYGFAYVLNSSIDRVVCHGVPSADDILRSGSIVNLDITLEKNGYIADSSKTYLIGEVDYAAKRLVRVTREAMWKGIGVVRPGATLGDIGFAIQPGNARRAAGAALRSARRWTGTGGRHDLHHRADDQPGPGGHRHERGRLDGDHPRRQVVRAGRAYGAGHCRRGGGVDAACGRAVRTLTATRPGMAGATRCRRCAWTPA
jgi:methionine aminopeptidase